MVDIWNVIECFRENGLNTLEAETELNISRVESILMTIYCQLNKRIPVTRQVDVKLSTNMLLNWLISAYDRYSVYVLMGRVILCLNFILPLKFRLFLILRTLRTANL